MVILKNYRISVVLIIWTFKNVLTKIFKSKLMQAISETNTFELAGGNLY